jgi:hypothetical protein
MCTLALQLADDHDRKDDLVLVKPSQREGIGEQNAGIEDEGTTIGGVGRRRLALHSRGAGNVVGRESLRADG